MINDPNDPNYQAYLDAGWTVDDSGNLVPPDPTRAPGGRLRSPIPRPPQGTDPSVTDNPSLGRQVRPPDPTLTPPPAPAPAPAPSGGGGNGGMPGGLTSPFGEIFQPPPGPGPFTPPPPKDLGGPGGLVPPTPTYNAPSFTPPPAFSHDKFAAPSAEEAMNDPGYKFRLDQGNQALQTAASAKGTLNDSGTLKALTDYGQNAASQEYQNVWNRDFSAWNQDYQNALGAYTTNYTSQYADPYKAQYQSYLDTIVNPSQTAYVTQASAGQHANDMNYQDAWNSYLQDYKSYQDKYANAWNQYLQDWNQYKDQRDSTFDKSFKVATA